MKLLRKNRKGFTLVELIVVIAIIGILAAILIPQFGGFQERAREKAAISEARAVATAIAGYMADSTTGAAPTKMSDLESFLETANYGSISAVTDSSNFTYVTKAETYTVTVTDGKYTAANTAG